MRDFDDPIPKILRVMSNKINRSVLLLLYDRKMIVHDIVKELNFPIEAIDNAVDELKSIGFVSYKITVDSNLGRLYGYYTITDLGKAFVDNLVKTFEEEIDVDNIPN